jgi:hypothetical protein
LDILTEAANNLGRKLATTAPDGSTTLKTRLVNALNESVQPFVARGVTPPTDTDAGTPAGFFFTELNRTADASTTNGTKSYSFPSGFREVFDLTVIDGSNSYKLIALPRRRTEELFPDPTTWPSKDRPRWYTRFGTGFELLPIPDKTYTIRMRYAIWPADLTSDTQLPDLTTKDDVLVARLTGEAFHMYQEYEADAQEWFAKSVQLLRESIAADPRDWDWEPAQREAGVNAPRTAGSYWSNPFISRLPEWGVL